MTTATMGFRQRLFPQHKVILVNGKPIKGRFWQSIAFSIPLAIFCAGIIAGAYFLPLEVHWYIHIGSFYWHGFDLKQGWDSGIGKWLVPGFFSTATWPLYRHGFRDLIEPAAATFGVKTLMAQKWRKNDIRLKWYWLVLRVIAVLVIAGVLSLCAVWLLNFGLPAPWRSPAQKYSIGQLVLGLIIGLIVHAVWAPAGNTIQGFFIDRAVCKADRKRATNPNYLPIWVTKPLAPPTVRERFCWTLDRGVAQQAGTLDAGGIWTVTVILFLVGCVGLLAKYGIAHGLHVPYLAP